MRMGIRGFRSESSNPLPLPSPFQGEGELVRIYFMDTQKKHPRTFSFEYFPPKDDAARVKLHETTQELAQLKPKYFSVTYGRGGSTRAGTYDTVKEITERGLHAAPHLSCIGATRASLVEQLRAYKALGIRHIVA